MLLAEWLDGRGLMDSGEIVHNFISRLEEQGQHDKGFIVRPNARIPSQKHIDDQNFLFFNLETNAQKFVVSSTPQRQGTRRQCACQ